MARGSAAAEGDAECFGPAGHVGLADAEFGRDVGESPAAGYVLFVEPVAVDGEGRAAGIRACALGNPVFSEQSENGVPACSELAAELPRADVLAGVEVFQLARGQPGAERCDRASGRACLAGGQRLGWRGMLVEDGADDVDRGARVAGSRAG